MRARLETAEREKESLQRQMRGSGASPHPPQTMAELQSQLDRINKQLLFKDQEVIIFRLAPGCNPLKCKTTLLIAQNASEGHHIGMLT